MLHLKELNKQMGKNGKADLIKQNESQRSKLINKECRQRQIKKDTGRQSAQ